MNSPASAPAATGEVSAPVHEVPAPAGDLLLSVQGVSKHYALWQSPSERLQYSLLTQAHKTMRALLPKDSGPVAALQRKRTALHRDFAALHEVSFELRRGESMGIIGRNGSGKSTLLQIIAGTLSPTQGRVEIYGRVAALLELGSGFNPEFTGRENVYLNASILGFSRRETDERFDEIAGFADIGQFLDEPVKTYSSGMMVRLAFSVSICVRPDVLIVDEALAVGDIFFTQKCFDRLHKMLAAGTTLLFVSHDLSSVQNLCTQATLLHEGQVVYQGDPEKAVGRYYALGAGWKKQAAPVTLTDRLAASENAATFQRDAGEVLAHNILPGATSRFGNKRLELVAAMLTGEDGEPTFHVEMMREMTFSLLLRANCATERPFTGLNLYDRMNNLIFAAGNAQLRVDLPSLASGDQLLHRYKVKFNIQPGAYTFTLVVSEPGDEGPNSGHFHDLHEGLGPIQVYFGQEQVWPFYGIAQLPMHALDIELLPAGMDDKSLPEPAK